MCIRDRLWWVGVEITAGDRGVDSRCAAGVSPSPSGGGQLGGCPSGPCEFAEVVAGQVEGPLEVGFDLAAEPELMAVLCDVDLTEDRFDDRLASGVVGLALLGP